jgi:hypothetical protein
MVFIIRHLIFVESLDYTITGGPLQNAILAFHVKQAVSTDALG